MSLHEQKQASLNHSSRRFELLLFYLGNRRRYGINVLKVKEIISCPPLNQLPGANPCLLGFFNSRGQTIPIIHLAQAVKAAGYQQLDRESMLQGSIITTEINRSTQGLWISSIDKIVEIEWRDIKPPSQKKGGVNSYVTGICLIENELIQILDIEKVLAEVLGIHTDGEDIHLSDNVLGKIRGKLVLLVDDSNMAVRQTIKALDVLGLDYIIAQDGQIALDLLKNYKEERPIDMIISDIEMPEMDGYTFVREMRKLDNYKDIHVLMHTSLNGEMNMQHAIESGANDILTKFVPSELADKIASHLLAKDD